MNEHDWKAIGGKGSICGRCIKVRGVKGHTAPGHVIKDRYVKIVDQCPSWACDPGNVDFSTTALRFITGYSWDKKKIVWEYAKCPDEGPSPKEIAKKKAQNLKKKAQAAEKKAEQAAKKEQAALAAAEEAKAAAKAAFDKAESAAAIQAAEKKAATAATAARAASSLKKKLAASAAAVRKQAAAALRKANGRKLL